MNQIAYRSGYKYQLAEDYHCNIPIHPKEYVETALVVLEINGGLLVRKNYAWDGPSGPTKDTLGVIRPSLVHDVVYQLIRSRLLSPEVRPLADDIYYHMMLEDSEIVVRRDYHPLVQPIMLKIVRVRARGHYDALLAFGSSSTKPSAEKTILLAP